MEFYNAFDHSVLWLVIFGLLIITSITIVLWAEVMKKPLAPYLALSGSIFFLTAIGTVFLKWMRII